MDGRRLVVGSPRPSAGGATEDRPGRKPGFTDPPRGPSPSGATDSSRPSCVARLDRADGIQPDRPGSSHAGTNASGLLSLRPRASARTPCIVVGRVRDAETAGWERNERLLPFSFEALWLYGNCGWLCVVGCPAEPQPRCGWIRVWHGTQGCPRSSANPGLGDRTPLALGYWVLVSCGEAGSCRFPIFVFLSSLWRTSSGLLESSLFHAKNRPSTERMFCINERAVHSLQCMRRVRAPGLQPRPIEGRVTPRGASPIPPGEGTRPADPWLVLNERVLSSLVAKKGLKTRSTRRVTG
jgi:hypothetical protein